MSDRNKWEQQKEVIQSLTGEVEKRLHLMADVNSKHWWGNQFFQFMQHQDYHKELDQMRREAAGLPDDLLVVLVADMITEEALPNYSARLATLNPDRTGIAEDGWSVWQRGWSAEEDQHGAALHHYLLLTGRVDMVSVSRTIFSLIQRGFEQDPSLYKGVFYPMFQEVATQVSHSNVAKLAHKHGVRTCTDICAKIAADEKRHAKFYREISSAIFENDPDQALVEYAALMKSGIVMPGENMSDGESEAPALFQQFSEVATDLEVYTPFDYANILERLNQSLGISDLRVSGAGARAQDFLCRLPQRIRRVADRKRQERTEKIPFAWIHDRAA